jgi:Fumarylacetoacetate (FAA) hydrolase family
MKILSFAADGKEWFGAARDDGIVTLNDKIGQPDLRAALAAGAWEAMRRAARDAVPDRKFSEITFVPVIPRPGKILCAGINYRSHAAEMGRELPKQPSMFVRFADTLVGHGGDMIRPAVSDNFDFEGELALVIGKGGRHIKAAAARLHLFRRRKRARLSEVFGDLGEEFSIDRPARTLDRHDRRDRRPEPPHADDLSQRPGGPALNDRSFDLFHPAHYRVLLGFHRAFRGRRHCDRHARRGRP